jgi:hypothetical protein
VHRSHTRNRSAAVGAGLLGLLALGVTPVGGQSPALPSPIATPLDPDAVVLVGRITGSNTGPGRPVGTTYSAQATMDVTLNLGYDRATATGQAELTGAYTGDCVFSDSGTVPIDWDSNPSARSTPSTLVPTEGRPAFALVQVYVQDPRYQERPIPGLYLSIGAGLGGEGGTCGHMGGRVYDITDVDVPLRVDLLGCSFFEILNANNGSWSGSCNEMDATGNQTVAWSAEFVEAYSPPE